eukprot:jgi/Tetstr1/430308/TSEL_020133.t1
MPSTATQQFPTRRSATGTRLHSNLCMDDMIKEFAMHTYTPMSEITVHSGSSRPRTPDMSAISAAKSPTKVTKTFLPKYLEDKKMEAREMSLKVNNKRSPSGNFFGTSNPSIYQVEKETVNDPRESLTHDALLTMGRDMAPSPDGAMAKTTKRSSQSNDALTQTGFITGPNAGVSQTWLLPHQTGTRDMQTAKAVCSTRTPNGAFAQRALAVYGRS